VRCKGLDPSIDRKYGDALTNIELQISCMEENMRHYDITLKTVKHLCHGVGHTRLIQWWRTKVGACCTKRCSWDEIVQIEKGALFSREAEDCNRTKA
jgi:hypothetical protein